MRCRSSTFGIGFLLFGIGDVFGIRGAPPRFDAGSIPNRSREGNVATGPLPTGSAA
jgi:hypothetical protein